MEIRRGDIYYADLTPVVGCEQGGRRPVLVIQNDVGNHHGSTVIVAAITSRRRRKRRLPTHIGLPRLPTGVKRTIRSKSFKGYLKEKDRNVRAAQEPEIIDILRACTNLRDQLLLLLLAETGFRIGEILGVDYTKDIDYEKQVLKVYFRDDNDNEARAKNAEYRSAKISRETFEFLLHYLAEYRRLLQRQSLLFINIRGETAGKPMRVESVYDMLDRMEEKTGIKLTPHMLRRYYAVSRRDAGWALELIQLALGHKHLDTTVKYLGILDNQLMTASREFYEKHSDLYGIKDLL